jgi:hypothetical protein
VIIDKYVCLCWQEGIHSFSVQAFLVGSSVAGMAFRLSRSRKISEWLVIADCRCLERKDNKKSVLAVD